MTDELLARIERLEEENRRLAAQVENLTPVPRRDLLKRVGGVALGAAALTAASPALTAAADDGQPILMGRLFDVNVSPSPTEYRVSGDRGRGVGAFRVYSNNSSSDRRTHAIEGLGFDYGVLGSGGTRAGVIGTFNTISGIPDTKVDQTSVGGVGGGSATGVTGVSDSGTGVSGRSGSNIGVHGSCDTDSGFGVFGDGSQSVTGVGGFSSSGTAVHGHSEEGRGVVGICDQTTGDVNVGVHGVLIAGTGMLPSGDYAGVIGESSAQTGVLGKSTNADGVKGHSTFARGASFSSGASAALRLIPGPSANPPSAGLAGDLYVDSTARLWYCSGGATWVRLA
jgi:hypothetical protein